MDMEKVKQGIDAFEDDKFSDAAEIFKETVKDRKNEWLKDKLGLKQNIKEK